MCVCMCVYIYIYIYICVCVCVCVYACVLREVIRDKTQPTRCNSYRHRKWTQ